MWRMMKNWKKNCAPLLKKKTIKTFIKMKQYLWNNGWDCGWGCCVCWAKFPKEIVLWVAKLSKVEDCWEPVPNPKF